MRKKIKKPVTTTRALKININEAIKLSNSDPATMLAIIEQSIGSSWQGFYALKDKGQGKQEDYFEKMLKEMEVQTNEERNGVTGIEGISDALPEFFC